MNPLINFPQANKIFKAPGDLDESQVFSIKAYVGIVQGGNLDGCNFVVVAWLPAPEELIQLRQGKPIYISMLGGLSPHFVTTDFDYAAYNK